MAEASARSAARRLLRPAVRAAVGFVVARPRLHGLAARVPVVRSVALRAFGPAPTPATSPDPPPPPADPNAAYLFRPGPPPPPGDADGVVTVEALVHLSRAPPAPRR